MWFILKLNNTGFTHTSNRVLKNQGATVFYWHLVYKIPCLWLDMKCCRKLVNPLKLFRNFCLHLGLISCFCWMAMSVQLTYWLNFAATWEKLTEFILQLYLNCWYTRLVSRDLGSIPSCAQPIFYVPLFPRYFALQKTCAFLSLFSAEWLNLHCDFCGNFMWYYK